MATLCALLIPFYGFLPILLEGKTTIMDTWHIQQAINV